MKVVDIDDVFASSLHNVLSKLVEIEGAWRALHHDVNAVLDDGDRGYQDDDGEKIGAHWVEPPEVRVQVDDTSGQDDTGAHEHVTEHVQVGGADVHVAFVRVAMVVSVGVAVIVTMVVAVIMSVVVAVIVAVVVSVRMTMIVSMRVAVVMAVVMAFFVMSVAIALLATQVVVTLSRVKNLHLNKVKNEGDAGDREHLGADDSGWLEESLSSLDKEPDSHHPYSCNGNHRANDFSTGPTVSQVIGGASLSKTERDDGNTEANNVR